jgi:hypothetical protein
MKFEDDFNITAGAGAGYWQECQCPLKSRSAASEMRSTLHRQADKKRSCPEKARQLLRFCFDDSILGYQDGFVLHKPRVIETPAPARKKAFSPGR